MELFHQTLCQWRFWGYCIYLPQMYTSCDNELTSLCEMATFCHFIKSSLKILEGFVEKVNVWIQSWLLTFLTSSGQKEVIRLCSFSNANFLEIPSLNLTLERSKIRSLSIVNLHVVKLFFSLTAHCRLYILYNAYTILSKKYYLKHLFGSFFIFYNI